MKEFIMVIGMWGWDGGEQHYIGQMALQQPMSEKQCEYMIDKSMWAHHYENTNYHLTAHCFPKSCAGKDKCE